MQMDKVTWGKFCQYSEMVSFGAATLLAYTWEAGSHLYPGHPIVHISQRLPQARKDHPLSSFIAFSTAAYLTGKAIYWITKAAQAKGLLSQNMQRILGWGGGFAGGVLCAKSSVPLSGYPCSEYGWKYDLEASTRFSVNVTVGALLIHNAIVKGMKRFVTIT